VAKQGWFKKLKRSITLSNVVRVASFAAGAIPVVGGAISTAANLFEAAKRQAQSAGQAAENNASAQFTQVQTETPGGGYPQSPMGPQPSGGLLHNPLVWAGAALAAFFLLRKR